jgi:Dolichyl-phosphate-mannose-protein mannosyltransferase
MWPLRRFPLILPNSATCKRHDGEKRETMTIGKTVSPPAPRPWLRRHGLVVGAFLFVLLLGLPTLIVPLYTDQTVFALAARTILSGGVPYRDLWDVKSPGVYFVYALAFIPLGQHMVSVRILDLANTALAMVAIYLLGRRLLGERAGLFAGCLYGVAYLTRAGFDGLGQTESFLALPVVLSLLFYRPETGRRAYGGVFLSGLMLGLAFSIKFSAIFYVLALPAIELLFGDRPLRPGPAVRRLSLAAAGFLAVQAAFALYLLAGGALRDFVDIQRLHVAPYTALHWSPPGESYLHFLGRVTHEYVTHSLFLVVPAGAALFLALAGNRRRETVLVALLVAASLVGVWSQGKFYPYHWLAMIFPLALAAGFAIDRIVALSVGRGPAAKRWLAYGLAGVSLVALTPSLLSNPYHQYSQFLGYATGRWTDAENEGQYGPFLRLDRELLAYVDANGGSDKSLFIWGNWPVIYWWADRPLVSRFVYDTGLSADWAPSKWRDELVAGFRANPPHYIAVAASGPQPWLTGSDKTSVELLDAYPGLKDVLDAGYEAVWANDMFRVYERK